jgi:signal transduction histidine kinase
MASLVAEGLAFAGSETLREPRVRVDLNAVIENVLEPMIDLGHDCRYSPVALPPVMAAPQTLARLVQNLVDNALRYGGSAEVHAQVADGEAGIDVADRGPGLPQAELERMFEPFVRGDASRGRDLGGTGLGLAIARNIAQAHGGRVWLEPRNGGGLVARLRWPCT